MELCIKIGDQVHCFPIPVLEIPVRFHKPGPGPVNYPPLFVEATILAAVQSAAEKLSDQGVRDAVQNGVKAATQALQKRAGDHVSIR